MAAPIFGFMSSSKSKSLKKDVQEYNELKKEKKDIRKRTEAAVQKQKLGHTEFAKGEKLEAQGKSTRIQAALEIEEGKKMSAEGKAEVLAAREGIAKTKKELTEVYISHAKSLDVFINGIEAQRERFVKLPGSAEIVIKIDSFLTEIKECQAYGLEGNSVIEQSKTFGPRAKELGNEMTTFARAYAASLK